MRITRESVSEAISFGREVFPKFTIVELALVLAVPIFYVLQSVKANRKLFKFDAEKNIVGLDASSSVQTMNSNEVWNWYLKNRLDGHPERCLPMSDQTKLTSSVNSRVKWEALSFKAVAATFASNDKTGTDVRERVESNYGQSIASRLVMLGTISGQGQVPDRFLFGVVVTDAEIEARRIGKIILYTPEWAMEEMLGTVDWTVIETPTPKSGVQWISPEQVISGEPIDTGAKPADDAAAAVAAAAKVGTAKPPVEEEKGGRRTKVQLDAQRAAWTAELRATGMFSAEEIQKAVGLEKFKDAEKAVKNLLAEASGAPQPPATDPAQQELPGTAEARAAPPVDESKPMVVTPPASSRTVSMPTLAALEGVKDIKADIVQKAGMTPPAPASQQPADMKAPPVVPAAVPVVPAPAPVVAPPPAGASASAEDLLSSLLKSTGQTP